MGFGLLFIGYLFSHGFTSGANYIVSIVGVVGTVILFFACKKLSLYDVNFKHAKVVSLFFCAAYLFNAVIQLCNAHVNNFAMPSPVQSLSRGFIVAVVFVLNFYMYKGISGIAKAADIPRISVNSVRNLVFMIIYYVVLVAAMVIRPYFPKAAGVLGLAGTIIGFVWLILSVVLVMTAYMRICPEGDENMPENPRGTRK